jgi:hypothetical protein
VKNHPPIFILVPLVVIACYLSWSFMTGSLRIRGREPIRRQENPHEYWYYMRIVVVIFAIMVGMIAWMFL